MNLHQFRFVQEAARRNLNLTEAAKALEYPDVAAFLAKVGLIRWSSTITTNVLAERRGSKVGLLVSKGYEQTLYGSARSPVVSRSSAATMAALTSSDRRTASARACGSPASSASPCRSSQSKNPSASRMKPYLTTSA